MHIRKNRGISNLSLNNKRSAISSFFSWLVDEEYIDKDPTRKIKKIKVTKKKKKAFTADEMERMRIACTDIRDRALNLASGTIALSISVLLE